MYVDDELTVGLVEAPARQDTGHVDKFGKGATGLCQLLHL